MSLAILAWRGNMYVKSVAQTTTANNTIKARVCNARITLHIPSREAIIELIVRVIQATRVQMEAPALLVLRGNLSPVREVPSVNHVLKIHSQPKPPPDAPTATPTRPLRLKVKQCRIVCVMWDSSLPPRENRLVHNVCLVISKTVPPMSRVWIVLWVRSCQLTKLLCVMNAIPIQ